jgi:uncharacterized protein YceK
VLIKTVKVIQMKKLLIAVAVTSLLSACGSTGKQYSQFNEQNQRQEKHVTQALDRAPEWMTRLPKSENAIYQSADESGASMSSAKMFAEAKAYAKICTSAGGKVRSQTKFFESDNGTSSTRSSEIAVRSLCPDVDITGVQTVDVVYLREGSRVRAMVLVALPIGSANVLKSNRDAEARGKEAFEELDEITTGKPSAGSPARKNDSVSVVQPNGTSSTLTLLPVDNAEYRARRAEAMQKPGAVVGQVTVR